METSSNKLDIGCGPILTVRVGIEKSFEPSVGRDRLSIAVVPVLTISHRDRQRCGRRELEFLLVERKS